MKRLIIIVEGDTEKEFVNTILSPYLQLNGVNHVQCFKIKHSKGGLSKYEHLKKDIVNCLYETDVFITTLIDFYALPRDFPKFKESVEITNKSERLSFLEEAIKEEIECSQNKKFENLLPYIQLHEFEALVFSSLNGIESLYNSKEADFKELEKVIHRYPNPEDINDHPNTAPSKRLIKSIIGYNKFNDGIMIIDEIGIEEVLIKCPRFNGWVLKLIKELT